MKYFYLLPLLFLAFSVNADTEYDASELNVCLKDLYTRLNNHEELIGETHLCNLSLKFANEKWLLFYDGYVRLNSSTRYSFLKLTEGMRLPEDIGSFRDVSVTFKITATSESLGAGVDDWPALEVQLLQISPNKSPKPTQ